MKIGLVTPYIYPLPGGVNAHVDELYQNLVVRGHDVRIISSTHGPQKSSEGDIIRLGYGWSVPTNGSVGTLTVSHRYGQLVQEMLDREQFDLLHFHEPFVPFLSLQLLRFSTSVNVATFHAYSGQSLSYEFGKRMLQRFARKLHGRIAVSAAARHFIERYFPGDYKVIPNGVDLRDFRSVAPFARWRDGTLNILYIGRFENRKGAMYLLKAYRQLRREGLDCRLLMIGAGPQEREIRRYIATRRLVGVELLGRVSDADKVRALATADVFVSPATGQESFGIVLLEAMAAGAPIVCSDIHGYKGVVRRGEQALLVPPKEVAPLAAAIGTRAARPRAAGTHGRLGPGARRPVRLAEHHGQGGRLLRLRHPAPGRPGGAAARVPCPHPAGTGAAAGAAQLGRCRPGRRARHCRPRHAKGVLAGTRTPLRRKDAERADVGAASPRRFGPMVASAAVAVEVQGDSPGVGRPTAGEVGGSVEALVRHGCHVDREITARGVGDRADAQGVPVQRPVDAVLAVAGPRSAIPGDHEVVALWHERGCTRTTTFRGAKPVSRDLDRPDPGMLSRFCRAETRGFKGGCGDVGAICAIWDQCRGRSLRGRG